jgi:hypothetical protein
MHLSYRRQLRLAGLALIITGAFATGFQLGHGPVQGGLLFPVAILIGTITLYINRPRYRRSREH